MNLTTTQLADVRQHIGDATPPTNSQLDEIYTRRLGLVGVVREVLSKRLAAFVTRPATFSVPGEYSQSTGDNIKALQDMLGKLRGLPDDSDDLSALAGAVGVAQLVRSDPAR